VRFFTPQAGATAEYTLYTRSGRRAYRQIGSQQTDFLELGGQTLVQLTKVGATTTPVYLHPDLLGSPRKASSGTRALLWQEHYDPYGAKLNGSETTVGYTGHAHDATGLTYMKARFYDPSQHRFLTPDPIHFVDDNPFTFNRYAYGKTIRTGSAIRPGGKRLAFQTATALRCGRQRRKKLRLWLASRLVLLY